ncbi:hypothetical protein [Geothrix fuzhouensis]|uniref:hypothetical protein n=1 Tax=Geothrix fuzhouensis TaxID=2966451 RepID=UPI002148ADD6|nr:hypothetical protein [Geothrix fuzhouensis]
MTDKYLVRVDWRGLTSHQDESWQNIKCLYAYLAPKTLEVLYIGKSWGVSVRGRWTRAAKEHFWNDLEKDRGITEHIPLLGELYLPEGRRLSSELLADVESLLIHRVSPWGNIQSKKTRISRPGLVVQCTGEWPFNQSKFHDDSSA